MQIRSAMRAKGLKDCDIMRLGVPYPFFPINRNDAREIMRFKLREHIAQRGLYVHHIQMCLSMSEDSQELFVDHLIENMYVEIEGIRPMVERMKRELTYAMTTHREYLERYIDPAVCMVPLAKRPVLLFQSIDYHERLSLASIARNPYLGERDRSHSLNEYNIEDCIECHANVAFLVLTCDIVNTRKKAIKRLPPSVHVLSAISTANPASKRKATVITVDQEEAERPTKVARLSMSSHSSGEEEQEYTNEESIQIEQEEEEVLTMPDMNEQVEAEEEEEYEATVLKERKVGRPRKIPDGFEFYDTRNKRSRFRCLKPECRDIENSLKGALKHTCKIRQ